jgi:uncharacterized OB-fold protein
MSADVVRRVFDAFPKVRLDHDNFFHYRGRLAELYLLNRCDECGTWQAVPAAVCSKCLSRSLTPREISGTGRLRMWSVMHQGPALDGVDYTQGWWMASVELDDQVGLFASAPLLLRSHGTPFAGAPVTLGWTRIDGASTPVFLHGASV